MTAEMLDGRALAARIEGSLQSEVDTFSAMFRRRPRLVVVLVGELAASGSYVKSKAAAAGRVGIESEVVRVPSTATTAELVALVAAIARDEHGPADGILVQLPLPDHVDTVAVLDAVPPDRDVDGFHPENAGLLSQGRPRFVPCTAAGVQRMLIDAGIETAGRHVVIVGRSDIVGKPLALLLASRGPGGDATVTICHSRSADLAAVTRQADIKAMVAEAHGRWGRIDVLHNNVGVSLSGGDAELLEITEEAFDRCVAINLKSCIFAAKHVIPIMRAQKSGVIINISSMAVITTYPYVAYKATKSAMVSFTEQLAYQNAPYGIRANVILPGLMNTPMAVDTRARSFKKTRAEVEAERDSKVPLGRKMGTGWDVANAALFLASDEASFITGVTLPVDGGASVQRG